MINKYNKRYVQKDTFKWCKMRTKVPESYEELRKHLQHPLSHDCVVILRLWQQSYKEYLLFMLNPFGGGICNTNELKLSDSFDLEQHDLKHFIIIYNK